MIFMRIPDEPQKQEHHEVSGGVTGRGGLFLLNIKTWIIFLLCIDFRFLLSYGSFVSVHYAPLRRDRITCRRHAAYVLFSMDEIDIYALNRYCFYSLHAVCCYQVTLGASIAPRRAVVTGSNCDPARLDFTSLFMSFWPCNDFGA